MPAMAMAVGITMYPTIIMAMAMVFVSNHHAPHHHCCKAMAMVVVITMHPTTTIAIITSNSMCTTTIFHFGTVPRLLLGPDSLYLQIWFCTWTIEVALGSCQF